MMDVPPRLELLQLAGWREWAGLPGLEIPALKAKLDTGARTSALHTCWLQPFHHHGQRGLRFRLRPARNNLQLYECQALVTDQRWVTDSGGHREKRFVIETPISLGGQTWNAELTLTARDNLLFRLLIGRTALRGRFLIDPNLSYHFGHLPTHAQGNL
jgi:hypothetical protein